MTADHAAMHCHTDVVGSLLRPTELLCWDRPVVSLGRRDVASTPKVCSRDGMSAV